MMTRIIEMTIGHIKKGPSFLHDYADLFVILIVGILCYGLLIPWLGFYWDDWGFLWIAKSAGAAGLTRYFAANRPLYGEIVKATTSVLGTHPWEWQVSGMLFRITAAVSLWWFVRLLLPKHNRAAIWVSLLFLVYPGFSMQFVSIIMTHFFMVLTFFFLSLCFTLLALHKKKRGFLFHIPALLFAAVNLLTLEYFFLLELLRPIVIIIVYGNQGLEKKVVFRKSALTWLPYLVLFLGATAILVLFPYQSNYPFSLLSELRLHPLQAIFELLGNIAKSFYTVLIAGWAQAFRLPDMNVMGKYTVLAWVGIVIASMLLLICFFLKLKRSSEEGDKKQRWPLQFILLGTFAILLGCVPFWLTGLPVNLTFPSNRFTTPTIFGTALIMAGLVGFLSLLPRPWRWTSSAVIVLLVAFSIGSQFQNANAYRRDWELQKRFFQQLAWRVPALQQRTLLLTNDLPSLYVSDNSITAPVNWIYAPDYHSGVMPYYVFYPSVRLGTSLPGFEAGLNVEKNYQSAMFYGNTAWSLTVYFNPFSCLRVLDPELDPGNTALPVLMRQASRISAPDRIIPIASAALPENIFGSELEHGWCYFYEKADLAAQVEDWQQVVELGEQAFALGDTPSDPAERFPFIEGYAHTSNWSRALELTSDSAAVTPLVQPVLCSLWQRIAQQSANSPEKTSALNQVSDLLACPLP
jgi:hypothetical protein